MDMWIPCVGVQISPRWTYVDVDIATNSMREYFTWKVVSRLPDRTRAFEIGMATLRFR